MQYCSIGHRSRLGAMPGGCIVALPLRCQILRPHKPFWEHLAPLKSVGDGNDGIATTIFFFLPAPINDGGRKREKLLNTSITEKSFTLPAFDVVAFAAKLNKSLWPLNFSRRRRSWL